MYKKLIGVMCVMVTCLAANAQRYHSIKPGTTWLDTNGKPIHAHSPQIFEKDGVYYWYGENKEHTVEGSNVWTYGIRAYRSTDFYNWEDMGLIIKPDTVNPLSPLHFSQTLDRPHILYNKKTQKWVCWIKSMDTDGYFVILQADRFEGPYQIVKSLKPEGYGVGDFDMYADPETGKGYVWFERPHWEMICAELTDDYLGTNGKFSEHFVGHRPPFTREAPSHFIRHGKHYMFTSGTTGYVPNPSKVAVFDDYHGHYTDLGCPHVNDQYDDSFGSQIACVVYLPEKNLYVALADRWLPQLTRTDIPVRIAKDYARRYTKHQPFERDFSTPKVKDKTNVKRNKWDTTIESNYVFLPVVFDAEGKPTLIWRDEWRLEDYAVPTSEQVGPQAMTEKIAPIEAPFEMPQLQRPSIPSRKVVVKMNKKGMSTHAIQSAIDKMSAQGGGTVEIPNGSWQSGRIELKSNVCLHLADRAELVFSGQVKDYLPAVFTRNEGVEMMSLGAMIYANGAKNIALTGRGRLTGPGRGCEIDTIEKNDSYIDTQVNTREKVKTPVSERLYDGNNGRRIFRPTMLGLMNCEHVLIEGVSLSKTIFWNVVTEYCDGVIIRGITIDSKGTPRGDAIDIESTRNVLIEYCSVNTTDDAYTMKAGRGWDALRVNKPTENVVIRRCYAQNSAGGTAIGTETGAGVRNVYVEDCVFDHVMHGSYLKTRRTRGGGGQNIHFNRVRMIQPRNAFLWDMLGEHKWMGELADRMPLRDITPLTPEYRDISFRNIIVEKARTLVNAKGLPERPVRNVLFDGVTGSCQNLITMADMEKVTFRNMTIEAEQQDIKQEATKQVQFVNVNITKK